MVNLESSPRPGRGITRQSYGCTSAGARRAACEENPGLGFTSPTDAWTFYAVHKGQRAIANTHLSTTTATASSPAFSAPSAAPLGLPRRVAVSSPMRGPGRRLVLMPRRSGIIVPHPYNRERVWHRGWTTGPRSQVQSPSKLFRTPSATGMSTCAIGALVPDLDRCARRNERNGSAGVCVP